MKNITELELFIPKFSLESLNLNIESCNFSEDLKKEEIKFDQKLILKIDDKDNLMEKLNETLKKLNDKTDNILMNKIEDNIFNFKERYNRKEDFKIITFNDNY